MPFTENIVPNSPIVEAFCEAIKPPEDGSPWLWAENNVLVDPTSPFQGYWRSEISPWAKELMEVFADNTVENISVMCSAQSAKTQTMLCLLSWALAQEPAPAMWVTSTGDEAAYFMKTRLVPTIKGCKPLARQLISGKGAINKMEVTFAAASLVTTGSASPSKLQSKPVRWLFLDEVRNYPEGALEMVQKRTRAYWNSRTLIVSTPDTENDAVHRAFLSGDQNIWMFPCPECEKTIPLKWDRLIWDKDIAKGADGVYDFEKLAETIRMACPECEKEWTDNPQVRRHISENGKFVAQNPTAKKENKSFHWNALLPPWVKWKDLVEEFVVGTSAIKNGDPSPLKDFINESLGEPWQEKMISIEDDSVDKRRGDYDLDEDWEEEYTRFLSADVQGAGGQHFWYVIRAYAKTGAVSRLITYGKCFSEAELLQVAKDNRVHHRRCLIDSGYQTGWVMRFCQHNGWKPFRGDGAKSYVHRHPKTKKAIRRIWTESMAEPDLGTKATGMRKRISRYIWSNDSAKDLLAEMIGGYVGNWTIARNTDQTYIKQMTAEMRVDKTNAKGQISHEWRQIRKDNHLRDCELMILVAAVATQTLGYDQSLDNPPIKEETP